MSIDVFLPFTAVQCVTFHNFYILFQITGQNGHNLRVQSKPIFSFGCLGQVCVDFPDVKVTNLPSHLLTRQAPTE